MDKYDEKADEIMTANGYVSSYFHKEIAAALRQAAADAYEDAANRSQITNGVEVIDGPLSFQFRSLAAALSPAQPGTPGENK